MSEQGGYRQGTPGKAYSNRTDLNKDRQPVRSAKAKTYGDRKRREESQGALPLPDMSNIPAPGEVPSLTAPTSRPGEPVMAGASMGAGPGPNSLSVPAAGGSQALFDLRALAAMYPDYEGFFKTIAWAEENM